MSRIEGVLFCDGCGVEVIGSPVVVQQMEYSCQDCASGLECIHAQQAESEDDLRRQGPVE